MHIPKIWTKASADCTNPNNETFQVSAWGWGQELEEAQHEASSRLGRLVQRIRFGEPFPDAYSYGSRPVREEILETFDGTAGDLPDAVLTRNRYGAIVLNTARLLFLDVDLQPPSLTQRILSLFSASRSTGEAEAVAKLRKALQQFGGTTFRLYRTAAGLRVIAIDRAFDPEGSEAQALMQATGTDPCFARLCRVQKSFRARLTPKPWRCACPLPAGVHPRTDAALQRQFADWVGRYEQASNKHATCRYLETIGTGNCDAETERLIAVHDRIARCNEALPLA